MIKHILRIIAHRSKTQFIDFLIDILVSSLQEYRRKNANGEFDVNTFHLSDDRDKRQQQFTDLSEFFNSKNK